MVFRNGADVIAAAPAILAGRARAVCRRGNPSAAAAALSFEPVVEAGAAELGGLLRLQVPALAQPIAQGDHLARLEQAHAVAEIKPRRKILADGERRTAAERLVAGYADVVQPQLRADPLGEQVARGRTQRLRRGADHAAFATLDLGQRLAGDQV